MRARALAATAAKPCHSYPKISRKYNQRRVHQNYAIYKNYA
jgi:hypothetical protein